jgi:heme/copper-type cytochrome/quinol oxidase subunit 4
LPAQKGREDNSRDPEITTGMTVYLILIFGMTLAIVLLILTFILHLLEKAGERRPIQQMLLATFIIYSVEGVL